jgi:hypothetical protein
MHVSSMNESICEICDCGMIPKDFPTSWLFHLSLKPLWLKKVEILFLLSTSSHAFGFISNAFLKAMLLSLEPAKESQNC